MMTRWARLPLRLRLTLLFAGAMTLLLVAVGGFVYVRTGSDLLDAIDAGIRYRAEILVRDVRARGPQLADVGSSLIERDEAFSQITDGSGKVIQSSDIVGGTTILQPSQLRGLDQPSFFDTTVAGIDNTTRVLAVPVDLPSGTVYVLSGSSLQDRRDQMLQLAATLAIGGPIALALMSWAGWLLAGAALKPVERMRKDAESISTSDVSGRLSLPRSDDEIARLGRTMNDMLDRIAGSVKNERRFVDDASHELRTPLAILKAELDLALSRPRPPEELTASLREAAEETDHLIRLAEDLLVISRAHGGNLPVNPQTVDLEGFVAEVTSRFRSRAEGSGVQLTAEAPSEPARVDPVRLRQALDDLIDNAIRHTPSGGSVAVSGRHQDGAILFEVSDSGDGFSDRFVSEAFAPFSRDPLGSGDPDGAGLGLAIVLAIANAHGGTASVANRPGGGATVTLTVAELD